MASGPFFEDVCKIPAQWSPPWKNWFSLNSDGSFTIVRGRSGGIIRGHSRNLVLAFARVDSSSSVIGMHGTQSPLFWY